MGKAKKKNSKPIQKDAKVIPFPTSTVEVALYSLSREITAMESLTMELRSSVLSTLLSAIKCKDLYTYQHSLRVGHYSQLVGLELGLSEKEIIDLETASILHDVGKIGVPEHILNKPERLDDDEFLVMKSHPEKSGEVLEEIDVLSHLANAVRHHHERYDGRGYPDKLKGDDIPLFARIILISDTFDSMTSDRPYRKGLTHQNSFEELEEFSGTQFDGDLVKKFIKVVKKDKKKKDKGFKIISLDTTFKKVA